MTGCELIFQEVPILPHQLLYTLTWNNNHNTVTAATWHLLQQEELLNITCHSQILHFSNFSTGFSTVTSKYVHQHSSK